MAGNGEDRVSQRARGGRDVAVAGRDQTLITAGDHTVITVGGDRAAELSLPGLLPRDVPGFTGRDDDVARLTGLVGGGRVVVTAIGGTAGVGKTALAVHVAHRLLPEFPDGHLYADLRGYTEGQDPVEPGEVLEVFLRRLGVPAEEVPAEVEERSGLLRQLLAGRRVLVVLDNARTEAQVRPLLPGAGGSLVLVTSRSVLPGLEVDERVSLDVLPEDEAVAMLARVIGDARAAAEPQAVTEVARLCGRLPLALRIAGQLLAAHPAWPASRLARMLTGERDRLARLGAGDLQVRVAFEVSYAQLAQEDARLFRLLGLHPGPDFDVMAAAALDGTEPGEAGPVLDRLAEAHLVTEDASGRFGLHDLLRLFARTTCQETDSPADQQAAEARLVDYCADLAGLLDSCVDPRLRQAAEQAAQEAGGTLPSMREALAVFQAERPGLLAALGLAAPRGWDEQVQRLSDSVIDSLTILRYLDDLLTVHEAALAAARRTSDRRGEGRTLNNLGNAYQELRRHQEAIDSYQQALAIKRETGDRHGEGQTLNNLGLAYQELRQYEEAIDSYQQSLAIYRDSGDRYGEGQTLNNLGNAYQELRQYEEAIDSYQQSLAIYRDSGDRYGEGQTLNNLGLAYQELRQYEEAIDSYQQSLAIYRESGDRYREGQTLNNLGNAYQELRQYEEAIDSYQQDIAIRRDSGDRHGEGQTLNNLGNAYRGLRRYEEAIDSYQQSLAIYRDSGDRYREGQTLNNLGNTYQELRRYQEAIDSYQQSLAIYRETGDRYGEGQTLNNLGGAYHELRRYQEAIDSYQQSLAIYRESGDRYREGQTLNNLGLAYQELRRYEEAIDSYQQSLAIYRESGDRYGEGQTLNNLGNAYQELRQYEEAIDCWREAAEAMRAAGDHDEAGRLEQLAASDQSRSRRRWGLRRRSSS
jgi:tetratricopeptide (TPR) repeat protein